MGRALAANGLALSIVLFDEIDPQISRHFSVAV